MKAGSVLIVYFVFITCSCQGQETCDTEPFDNSGNEFYSACTPNRFIGQAQCGCYVTTGSDTPVNFTVDYRPESGSTRVMLSHTAVKGDMVEILIPKYLDLQITLTTIFDNAVHFKTVNRCEKIIVYCINEDAASTDAYLALPVYHTTSGEYIYTMISTFPPDGRILSQIVSFFVVIINEDDTTLFFSLEVSIVLAHPQCISIPANRRKRCRQLTKGTVFVISHRRDLTGSVVESDKPITVLTGHQCANLPADVTACDHLVEQIPPKENLGFSFLTVPLLQRDADAFRIVAVEDGTVVTICCNNHRGNPVPVLEGGAATCLTWNLNAGQHRHEIILKDTFCCVESDLPIHFQQFALGHSFDQVTASDPFMVTVPPIGQFLNEYTLIFSRSTQIDTRDIRVRFDPYLSIMIPKIFYQPSKIFFDDYRLNALPGGTRTSPVKDINGDIKGYAVQYKVPDSIPLGPHRLYHTNKKAQIGVIVYGFERENTYGYLGGLALNPLSIVSYCFSGLDFMADVRGGIAKVVISRTGPTKNDACITMKTSDDTAIAGTDYVEYNADCCFTEGRKEAVCEVVLIDDGVCGVDAKSFNATLVPEDDQFACEDIAKIALKDECMIFVMLKSNETVVREDDGSVEICLMSNEPFPKEFTIPLTLSSCEGDPCLGNGAATAGSDYGNGDYSVIFVKGSSTACTNIPILDNSILERKECFKVAFTIPSDPLVVLENPEGPLTGTVNILDDDELKVGFESNFYSHLESDGTAKLVITSDITAQCDFTVQVQFQDISATAPDDYSAEGMSVTFPAGSSRVSTSSSIVNDALMECLEHFQAMIIIPSENSYQDGQISVNSSKSTSQISITDDSSDAISISYADTSNPLTVSENGSIMFSVEMSGMSQYPVVVMVTSSDDTATVGADFESCDQVVTFAPRETTKRLTCTLINDEVAEPEEAFSLSLKITDSCPGAAIREADLSVIIQDDDQVLVQFNPDEYEVNETAGFVTLNLVADKDFSKPFSVAVNTADISASAGVDYGGGEITVQFTPGERTASFDIPIQDDTLAEGNEFFEAIAGVNSQTESSGLQVGIGTADTATVMIIDDDGIVIQFSKLKYLFNESIGSAILMITASGTAAEDYQVDITYGDNTATNPGDYSATTASVTLSAGQRKATLSIPIISDNIMEGTEDFRVFLSVPNESAALGVTSRAGSQTVVCIVDDDSVIVHFERDKYPTRENDKVVTLDVVVDGDFSVPFYVEVETNQGTALDGSDYGGGKKRILFEPGQNLIGVDFNVIDDSLSECEEEFTGHIVIPGDSASLGVRKGVPDWATVTISDDDSVICRIVDNEEPKNVEENIGCVNITIQCSGSSAIDFTLIVVTTDITAVDAEDFTGSSVLISFLPNQQESFYCIPILNDVFPEPFETFDVGLFIEQEFIDCGISVDGQRRIGIFDDDAITIVFDPTTYIVDEFEGVATLHMVTSSVAVRDYQVEIRCKDETAVGGADFDSGPHFVTVLMGTSSVSVDVSIFNDTMYEGREYFQCTIFTDETTGITPGREHTATVDILDDDCVDIKLEQDLYCIKSDANYASGRIQILGHFTSPVAAFFYTEQSCYPSEPTGSVGEKTVKITFEPEEAGTKKEFNLTLEEGEKLFFYPSSLDTTNPDCKQISIKQNQFIKPKVGVLLSSNEYFVNEDSGNVSILVYLEEETVDSVFVAIETTNRTAKDGKDFIGGNFIAKFDPGQREVEILIPILDDEICETPEFFTIQIRADKKVGSPSTAMVYIIDNDGDECFQGPCYNRTESGRNICMNNDIVLIGTLSRLKFADHCIYRMTIRNVYKGKNILPRVKGQRVNVQFPFHNCVEGNHCIQLIKEEVYLVGGQLVLSHKGWVVQVLLPNGFITDNHDGLLRRKLSNLQSCTNKNGNPEEPTSEATEDMGV